MRLSIWIPFVTVLWILSGCESDDSLHPAFIDSYRIDWEHDFTTATEIATIASSDQFKGLSVISEKVMVIADHEPIYSSGQSPMVKTCVLSLNQGERLLEENLPNHRLANSSSLARTGNLILQDDSNVFKVFRTDDQLNLTEIFAIKPDTFSFGSLTYSTLAVSQDRFFITFYEHDQNQKDFEAGYRIFSWNFSGSSFSKTLFSLRDERVPLFLEVENDEMQVIAKDRLDQWYWHSGDIVNGFDQGLLLADSTTTDRKSVSYFAKSGDRFILGGNNRSNHLNVSLHDRNKSQIWQRDFADYEGEQLLTALQTADGGVILGLTGSDSKNTGSFILLKLTNEGELNWKGDFFSFKDNAAGLTIMETPGLALVVLSQEGLLMKLSPAL